MKRLVLTLFTLHCFAWLHAQAYQKLLTAPVTSFMVVDLGFLAKPQAGLYKIPGCSPTPVSADSGYWQVYGDTVFKNINYKHVYDNGSLVGIIREDTLAQKVYFRTYCDTTPEILLYDFSLQQGDTISYDFPFSAAGNLNSGVFTVDSIRLMYNYTNRYGRHFFLSNHDSVGQTLEIAEGIGSLNHPIFLYYWFSKGVLSDYATSLSHPPIYFTRLVSCKWDDAVKVYADTVAYYLADGGQKTVTVTIHDSCDYTSRCCIAGVGSIVGGDVQIIPNPASETVQIVLPAYVERLELINSVGAIVIAKRPACANVDLPLDALPSGIYLLKIYSAGSIAAKRLCVQH